MLDSVALDTETTGSEFLENNAAPFALYACDCNGKEYSWEWEVNPVTRLSVPNEKTSRDIKKFTREYKTLVFHHAKFDIRALESVGVRLNWKGRIFDTQVASHVLNNVYSHKLKDLSRYYLGRDNTEEVDIKSEVIKARKVASKEFPSWRLGYASSGGKEGNETYVALDYWLFKSLAKELNYPKEHPWWTICDKYGYGDVIRTMELFNYFKQGLNVRDHWKVYKREISLLEKSIYDMETRGINIIEKELDRSMYEYTSERDLLEDELSNISNVNIRSSKELCEFMYGVPKTELNDSGSKELKIWCDTIKEEVNFSYFINNYKLDYQPIFESQQKGCLKLPVTMFTKTSFSTGKGCLVTLLNEYNLKPKAKKFVSKLRDWKDVDKAIQQLETISRFKTKDSKIYFSLNQNGTKTTRVSASNPNPQQISKGKDFETDDGTKVTKYKIRSIFGPKKNRVWYCIDYSQLQLRIFAYLANEKDFINALENGYDGHQFTAASVYGKNLDAKLTPIERRVGKNVNFGYIFGASNSKIDQTAGVKGLMKKVEKMFPHATEFMRETKKKVRLEGYVSTPYGYKLQIPYKKGRPQEHAGVNYIVQGCEGDIVKNAMIKVSSYLNSNKLYKDCNLTSQEAYLLLQVHDELIFDFPTERYKGQHKPALRHIVYLMEKAGEEMGMITPVDVDIASNNWANAVSIPREELFNLAN